MNSSERLKLAINMKKVDRVPNAPYCEAPICKYYGKSFYSALMNGNEMAKTHLVALEKYKYDWIVVGMALTGGIIPEALGCKVDYPEDAFPIIRERPIKKISDIDKISSCNFYTAKMEEFLKGVSILKAKLRDKVPIACGYTSPFIIYSRIRGVTELMEDIYMNPDLVHELQKALVPVDIEIGRALINAGVKYILYGADMECPLLISPQSYKDFVDSPTTEVVNELNKIGGDVLIHMCGPIVETGIVDMLMKMDIKGIMPGNLTASTVLDLRELKNKVEDRICIFGNINPNGKLLIGTPQEVDEEVKLCLEKAKGWRGYIFSNSGTISSNTPKENFEAMNEAVKKYGAI